MSLSVLGFTIAVVLTDNVPVISNIPSSIQQVNDVVSIFDKDEIIRETFPLGLSKQKLVPNYTWPNSKLPTEIQELEQNYQPYMRFGVKPIFGYKWMLLVSRKGHGLFLSNDCLVIAMVSIGFIPIAMVSNLIGGRSALKVSHDFALKNPVKSSRDWFQAQCRKVRLPEGTKNRKKKILFYVLPN